MVDKTQLKILYIEDDLESREVMSDILHFHGFKFFSASRGIEGIEKATKEMPDLILMDINLPDMQGYEVTTILKSNDKTKNIPIIALTGFTGKGAKELTLAAGCDGYISKPINITEFLLQIDEYLQGRKDTVAPEIEKEYLAEYNVRLVEKLQAKIEELGKMNLSLSQINEELSVSKAQLTEYNNRLFYMNNLANLLRLQKSPQDLLQLLPFKLKEGFSVDRSIIFEYDDSNEKLKPLFVAGVATGNLKKLKLTLSREFYKHLRKEHKVLWVKDKSEIIDSSLMNIAQNFNSLSFIFASISGWRSVTDDSSIFSSINTSTIKYKLRKKSEQLPKKLLLFIDRGRSQKPFLTYEIRILKAFIQSISIIYENMLLYHDLYDIYRIREKEAITDPLTSLHNYRYFRTESERELLRADRYNKPFSLAIIDIDNFKPYNDTHGHLAGDKVLIALAHLLRENTRKSDIIARYGGDEFIIILPELELIKAKSLAEKLCDKMHQSNELKKLDLKSVELSISVGIASYPDSGKTIDKLLKKADSALYEAKKIGKNTVSICA
jgi:diguanylate cyclase (GGDEF)-like protein